jgi:hypothetical protein
VVRGVRVDGMVETGHDDVGVVGSGNGISIGVRSMG